MTGYSFNHVSYTLCIFEIAPIWALLWCYLFVKFSHLRSWPHSVQATFIMRALIIKHCSPSLTIDSSVWERDLPPFSLGWFVSFKCSIHIHRNEASSWFRSRYLCCYCCYRYEVSALILSFSNDSWPPLDNSGLKQY